ncbi:MAG: hypothetical protein H0X62_01300 [Bacteroidetes bacterium]|nr:hypothetical protein [Bacteroidota bacterium]
MAKTSETGHAKNVANFAVLIDFIEGYGPTYNPTLNAIKLVELKNLHTQAETGLSLTNQASATYKPAINAREQSYESLSKLINRVLNALQATGASERIIADAKTHARKIKGERSSKIVIAETAKPGESISVSTSQMSFDMRLENFNNS